jgi:hypothetical protein
LLLLLRVVAWIFKLFSLGRPARWENHKMISAMMGGVDNDDALVLYSQGICGSIFFTQRNAIE